MFGLVIGASKGSFTLANYLFIIWTALEQLDQGILKGEVSLYY